MGTAPEAPVGREEMSTVLAAEAATGRDDKTGTVVQNMNLMLGLDETTGLNV